MTSQEANRKPAPAVPATRRRQPSNLVPMLVVCFAVLSALVLFAWGPDGTAPAPQPNYRAEAPPALQPPAPQ